MDVIDNVNGLILTTNMQIVTDATDTVPTSIAISLLEPSLSSMQIVVSPALPALSDAGDMVSYVLTLLLNPLISYPPLMCVDHVLHPNRPYWRLHERCL